MQLKSKPESQGGQADARVPRAVGTGTPSNLTWATLVKDEPQLKALLAEAKCITDNRSKSSFCANAAWYGYAGWPGLEPRLVALVGWGRPSEGDPVLHSQEAYDLAYHRIYDVLPDCRNCGCM